MEDLSGGWSTLKKEKKIYMYITYMAAIKESSTRREIFSSSEKHARLAFAAQLGLE